jgi:hypothetical protein
MRSSERPQPGRQRAPELLVGATLVGLGSLAALALPAVWMHAGVGLVRLRPRTVQGSDAAHSVAAFLFLP